MTIEKQEPLLGYCVSCKTKREIKDPKKVSTKQGKPAISGVCSKCGTKMFRIGVKN